MIDRPRVRLTVTPHARFKICGAASKRVQAICRRWSEYYQAPLPDCRVDVQDCPRQHQGLGLGTQLSLAVTAGLNAFSGRDYASPLELASSSNRGKRSAVGTYGFGAGGFIYEVGKRAPGSLSSLGCRLDFPASWRFVLIQPAVAEGLSGGKEVAAFSRLTDSPPAAAWLTKEIHERMIPALENHWFDRFSDSVYHYGRRSGLCFASIQGGPYNGKELAELVHTVRSLGVRGVGQSSWGPTIFAILPSHHAARRLQRELRAIYDDRHEISIAGPDNRGATIDVRER